MQAAGRRSVASPELGPEWLGNLLIVRKALCGLRSSGHAQRKLISETLQFELKLDPMKADPDVHIRSAAKPDGFEHCKVTLVCVDDTLVISGDVKPAVDHLAEAFELKLNSLGEPDQCLGANTGKHQLWDGFVAWFTSADDHVKEAVDTTK
jgi:hypothetical protein